MKSPLSHCVKQLVYILINHLAKLKRRQEIAKERHREEFLVIRNFPEGTKSELTQSEKRAFEKMWGWIGDGDIAVNEDNQGVLIEANCSQPGVIGEQLCTGPIFGARTQEVIEYCKSKPFFYNKAIACY